jgi:hypothetical protein
MPHQSRLFEQLSEVCDVLEQLSHPSPDGPCWCEAERADTLPSRSHSPMCVRARAALRVAQVAAVGLDAPGYGFGV